MLPSIASVFILNLLLSLKHSNTATNMLTSLPQNALKASSFLMMGCLLPFLVSSRLPLSSCHYGTRYICVYLDVPRGCASDYTVGTVLERVFKNRNHVASKGVADSDWGGWGDADH